MQNQVHDGAANDGKGFLVARAFYRAGKKLGLKQNQLADVIGLSGSQMSRLAKGEVPVSGKQHELAVYLIRVFRSLDAMTDGHDELGQEWIHSRNEHLGGERPVDLIKEAAGLVDVMNYLDAARAPI